MLRLYKCYQVDESEDEEEWSLNEYIGDDYVLLSALPQKESNHSSILVMK